MGHYIGILTLDMQSKLSVSQETQRFWSAIQLIGWKWVETSAWTIASPDIQVVLHRIPKRLTPATSRSMHSASSRAAPDVRGFALKAAELFLRQVPKMGPPSNFTFIVQYIDDGKQPYKAASNFTDPVGDILKQPLPSDAGWTLP